MSFAVTRALSAVVLLVLGFALQALGRTPPVDLGPIGRVRRYMDRFHHHRRRS